MMKKKKHLKLIVLFVGLIGLMSLSACSKDDDPFARVAINETGSDLGGDVTGDGGSTSESYVWNNPLAVANWSMDITATNGGSFQLIIEDADGAIVSDRTLTAGVGEDSADGVTAAGVAGDWTIRVVLSDFNGNGSFWLGPGN